MDDDNSWGKPFDDDFVPMGRHMECYICHAPAYTEYWIDGDDYCQSCFYKHISCNYCSIRRFIPKHKIIDKITHYCTIPIKNKYMNINVL